MSIIERNDKSAKKNNIVLSVKVKSDEITKQITNIFDYDPSIAGVVTEVNIPSFPTDYQIGLIVGSSGSGKSTILKETWGGEEDIEWDNSKSIASNFNNFSDVSEKFGAVGLNSIPTWLKPYNVLSNGERFRADLARRLKDDAVIDEFTSVVNREVAMSACMSIEKYIRQKNLKRVTFSSCHDDIIPYLRPDWIYNTDTHEFYNGKYLCRPKINIKIYPCGVQTWDMFKQHHYLSGEINKASRCYIGTYNDIPIVFASVISMPSGSIKHAYREHRLVVLPDYQGMGIGNKFSEAIAEAYHSAGCRYFSKTANPRVGEHRNKSSLWKPTSKNRKTREDYNNATKDYHGMLKTSLLHADRLCYSHEYVGDGIQYEYNL